MREQSPFDALNQNKPSGGPNARGARTPPVQRHRLRSVEEMPNEETPVSKIHISTRDYPEGFDLLWAAASIYGQPQPDLMAERYRMGWEHVHAEDFDGRYRKFAPTGHEGPIEHNGLVLMARPKAWSDKARARERHKAQAAIKNIEERHRGGVVAGPSLLAEGAQHQTARMVSGIRRTVEPLDVGPQPDAEQMTVGPTVYGNEK
jgi:hypothetical protein